LISTIETIDDKILPGAFLIYSVGLLFFIDNFISLMQRFIPDLSNLSDVFVIFIGMVPWAITVVISFSIYWTFHFFLESVLKKYDIRNVPGYKELHDFEVELQKYEVEKRVQEEEIKRLEDFTVRQFWVKQDGYTFEKNIADIFKRLGYQVKLTKGSGDEGVDIFLDEDTIVQCKATESQISPAVVRDLFGAMHHFNATKGIIVSTGGFSSGCHQFAHEKNIELWDLNKLLEVAGKLDIGYKGDGEQREF